jgi:hypothetical protein
MEDGPVYPSTPFQPTSPDKIEFKAEVVGVRTIKDGGIRLTLDLEEKARLLMPVFAGCQQDGVVLKIEAEESKD